MRRGDIYLADLDPIRGSEANKTRPVIIVSNNGMNTAVSQHDAGVLSVVPVTSDVRKVYDFQVFLPSTESGLQRDSKAQAEQLRVLDVSRLSRFLGSLPSGLQDELDDAIRLHLAL